MMKRVMTAGKEGGRLRPSAWKRADGGVHHPLKWVLAVACVVQWLWVAQAVAAPKSVEQLGANVLAKVNGEEIHRSEVEARILDHLVAAGITAEDLKAEDQTGTASWILDQMITEKLLDQASRGVAVDEEVIAAAVGKKRAAFPSDEAFRNYLASVGKSADRLPGEVAKEIRRDKWVEEEFGERLRVSEGEVAARYQERISDFKRPAQVHARQVLFRVKRKDPASLLSQQEAMAREFVRRIGSGENPKVLSESVSGKSKGTVVASDLGWIKKDEILPELGEALFALSPGQVSQPIQTRFGWHVVWVEGAREASVTPIAEVRRQVESGLQIEKEHAAVQNRLAELRRDADIVISPLLQPRPNQPAAKAP